MSTPVIDPARLRAILFDVDGTLYRQGPVRRALACRLLRMHARRPMAGLRTARSLLAYRRAQEHLRRQAGSGDLGQQQLQLASRWTGAEPGALRSAVSRWMEEEPLGLLRASVRDGLAELLDLAGRRGLRLAACSDYPAARKLGAMGIAGAFPVVVSAQDPDVQRFKPDPRVLETALRRLGVEKEEALYVGDRPEVDAVAARRAGIACAIVGREAPPGPTGTWVGFADLRQLAAFLG